MHIVKTLQVVSILMIGMLMLAGIAGADDTIVYNNAKSIGMGGSRIAGGFTYNGFVDNPALLSRVSLVRFSIANVPIGINKDLQDVANFIKDNSDKFEDYDELSVADKQEFMDDIEEFDGKWGRVNVAPMVDVAANVLGYGIGLAVFNNTDVAIKMDKGIYEPRVWGQGSSSMAVVLGVAKPLFMFYPGLTVGMNLKYIDRRQASLFQIPASDLGDISDTLQPINDEIKDNKNTNMAVDLGALLDLPLIGAEIGATMHSIGDGRGASLDLGVAKRMYGDNLLLLADYIDFLDNNKENMFNKIHFGAEYRAQVLALRAGISKGYPSIGFGLNFRVLDIDYAWYTEELSKGPGGNDEGRHIVQLKIGWN